MAVELWSEKYRPGKFEDILDQKNVVNYLRSYVKNHNLPNLLFYGKRGTGKTSMAYIISRELYGDYWDENLAHLDASDFFERGKGYLRSEKRFHRFYSEYKSVIEIFKDVIGEYASLAPINTDFKIIFFSNAESLPTDAQHALRRMMEKFNRTSRFIFETSSQSKLISPLRSRCLSLHFKRVSDESISMLIGQIADREDIKIAEGGINALAFVSEGDVKRAINTLQAASTVNPVVDSQTVFEVVKMMNAKDAAELIEHAFKGNFIGVRNIIDNLLINQGFLGEQILSQVKNAILKSGISDRKMAQLLIYVSDADQKIRYGLNDRIHLEEMAFKFKDVII